MPRPYGLSQWQHAVSTHLPHLSAPYRRLLAFWSMGIVLAQRCGLTSVTLILAQVLQQSEATLRERLRDGYRAARHKRGATQGVKRRDLDVTACFAPLLRWALQLPPSDCRTLALAMDASTLGQRSPSSRSVSSSAVAPSRWPGRSSRPRPKAPGDRTGKRCLALSTT